MNVNMGQIASSFGKRMFLVSSFILASCASTAHDVSKDILRGNELVGRGDYASALSFYEAALKKDPQNTVAVRNKGIVLVKIGKYQEANRLLRESWKFYKGDSEVLYFLGETSRGLENYKNAIIYYNEANRLKPELKVQKALAWAYFKQGETQKSMNVAIPLLRKNQSDLQLRLIVSSNLNVLKQYDKTIQLLKDLDQASFASQKSSISADAERALLYVTLADAWSGKKNFTKAVQMYTEVLNLRPFLVTALMGDAKSRMALNQPQEAQKRLERAVRAAPQEPEAYYYLALLGEKKDPKKSMYYYQKFLTLSQERVQYADLQSKSRMALGKLKNLK